MSPQIRTLLVYPNIWQEIFPLALLTLSAVLKQQEVEVGVFCAEHRRQVNNPPATVASEGADPAIFAAFCARVDDFQPQVIAFSIVEDAFPLACQLLDSLADFDGIVIAGGVFATFAPEKCLAHPRIDAICVGEGEQALSQLCTQLRTKRVPRDIPGLWIKQANGEVQQNPPGPPINLAELPPPDYSILDRSQFSGAVPLIAHRGCPYSCTFCNSPAQARLMQQSCGQAYFRKQGMPALRRDLQVLMQQHANKINQHGLYFCSDTFLALSKREFDEFIEMYSDFQLPFVCHTTAETISEHKIQKLVSAGLKLINIGVQHGNEAFRKNILHRPMSNRELIKRFDITAACGATTSADFIMGLPLETPALAQDSIDLSNRIRATAKLCSLFVPYHGTVLRELAIERGYLSDDQLAVWSPEQSQLNMADFPPAEITRMLQSFRAQRRTASRPINR